MSLYAQHVKEYLVKILSALGMDVRYERASGNTLYYRDPQGQEVPVLDLVGGYGALILGHNHPEIISAAKQALDCQVPIHAQFSVRERSGQLAARLNDLVKFHSHQREDFNVTFANSGAEAVEAAIKHAELERVLKVETLVNSIQRNIEEIGTLVRVGKAELPENIFEHTTMGEAIGDVRTVSDLVAGIIKHNSKQLSKRPVFLALEKSFHGKLVGSVQLTYNKMFRRPFQYFGLKTRFIAINRSDILDQVIREERMSLLDLAIHENQVCIRMHELPIFSAFIVEPVQGEGGVHSMDEEFGRHLRKVCNELDCPLIIDEIQSGMGRTGTLLASSLIHLKGDYYVLSKSLGGGISKISAALIKKSRYRKEFNLLHSSTFAEDDFSSAVALKVLDILESNNGEAYRIIQERGESLRRALLEVQHEFPEIILEVRGKGLFLGVEFADQSSALSPVIRGSAYSKSLGYVLSGYILKEERIRVVPTGSASNVLRLEPSLYITDDDIQRTASALRRVCMILRYQDAFHLIYHLTNSIREKPRNEIIDFRYEACYADRDNGLHQGHSRVRKVAFINHLITAEGLSQVDPSLSALTAQEMREFVLKMDANKKSAPYDPVRIQSPTGAAVDFILYPLCVTSEQMVEYLKNGKLQDIRDDIEERIEAAKNDGCEIAGLGMYTSIVTNNCTSLTVSDMAFTSGNALTISMGVEAIDRASNQLNMKMENTTIVIVGAAGNVASTYASLLAQRSANIVLLGSEREGSAARLQKTAYAIYEDTWKEIVTAQNSVFHGLTAELRELSLVKEWLQELNAPVRNIGRTITEYLKERYGQDPFIRVAEDRAAIKGGHIVVCAANTAEPFLSGADFRENAIVCDIAVPNNVGADVPTHRHDIIYIQGGIVATPNGESLHPGARAFLQKGQLFACMAESVVMGLAGLSNHFSYGAVSRQQVHEISSLAKAHGFRLADYKMNRSL